VSRRREANSHCRQLWPAFRKQRGATSLAPFFTIISLRLQQATRGRTCNYFLESRSGLSEKINSPSQEVVNSFQEKRFDPSLMREFY